MMEAEENEKMIKKEESNQYGSVNWPEEDAINGETPQNYKNRWRSIRVLYLTLFFSSVQFAIVMSSLWPYLKKVDKDVNETFLGWTNSGFSLCQVLGSIVLGIWCHNRPAKEPLIFSLMLLIIGSLLYAYAEAFTGFGRYAILIGRLLLGASAGNAAVCRSVVSQSTTLDERTVAFSNTAIAQALAFFFGPAMQVAVVPLGDKGIYFKPLKLSIDIYTAPGFLGIIMGLFNIIIIVCYFREWKIDIYSEHGKDDLHQQTRHLRPDLKAIAVSALLFFVVLCIFALNETIITPLVMSEFAWTSHQAVLYCGIILSVSGVLSVICFQSIKKLTRRFGERNVVAAGFVIMLAGFIVYLPWGNKYPVLKGNIGNLTLDAAANNVGCPIDYKWCHNTPKIFLSQFLIGLTLVAIGYAYAFLVLNTIYSKILGPGKHGYYMAFLTAVGSFARVIGPLLVSHSYVLIGPRWTFLIVDCILTFSILLIGIYRHRLVPFHEYISNYAKV